MIRKAPVDRKLYEKWLPAFQDGMQAKKEMHGDDFDDLPRDKKIAINHRSSMGDQAFQMMYDRIMILAEKIIQREVTKPRSFHVLIEREDLESAAYEGIYNALCNMKLNKMKSPTNYVLQWVDTKVTRAALKMEASTGLSPSKLRLYKKIAAVRRSIKKATGKEPNDNEVLEYFHSGNADFRSVNGRIGSNRTSYKSNANIKIKDIHDQGMWDKGYNLHTPVTDTYEIDAEIHHNDDTNDLTEDESAPDISEPFWRGYMDYIGIVDDDQDAIADELQLFPMEPTFAYNDEDRKKIAKDFIRLIQNPLGKIAEYSIEYAEKNGDGFWRAFIENLKANDTKTEKKRKKSLHMSVLKIHNRDN
jgi:hypothetical protein